MTALPVVDAYPAVQRNVDPLRIRDEIRHVITDAITNHPRSLQRRIGPSEIDNECARRIGYKLLDLDEVNNGDIAWLPTIGTGVHGWLEEAFTTANLSDRPMRWLTELTVCVGEILGAPITGHMDLYDRQTATVLDWKIVGPTTLKKYKSQGPGQQYRGQAHLYGRGAVRRGLPVDRVMIAFLPRNAGLDQAHWWSEPYDETVALDALERANGIALATQLQGVRALELLPTADAYCTRCPWYRAGSTNLARGCPGDPSAMPPRSQDQLMGLI